MPTQRIALALAATFVAVTLGACSATTPVAAVQPSTTTHAATTTAATPRTTATVQSTPTPAAPKPAPTPAKPQADGSAELGCTHFRNIMADVTKGILTDAELRTKLQEVYDTAHVSQNAGIPDGAQAMLAADTAGDGDALKAAIVAFDNTCRAVGA